ncbi:MAG: VOC family protein [Alphaproteobacteria bacterium]
MKFRYAIIYVPDVEAAIDFYKKAFGFQLKFMPESKLYGELDTGATSLAFVAEKMAEMHGAEITRNAPNKPAAGIEIAFTSDNVQESYDRAVEAGAVALKEPKVTPWGQTIAYVRDLNGVLVELCSPIEY